MQSETSVFLVWTWMTCGSSRPRMTYKPFQMNPISSIRMIIYRFRFHRQGLHGKLCALAIQCLGKKAMHVSLPNINNQKYKTIRNNSAVWKTDSECHRKSTSSRCLSLCLRVFNACMMRLHVTSSFTSRVPHLLVLRRWDFLLEAVKVIYTIKSKQETFQNSIALEEVEMKNERFEERNVHFRSCSEDTLPSLWGCRGYSGLLNFRMFNGTYLDADDQARTTWNQHQPHLLSEQEKLILFTVFEMLRLLKWLSFGFAQLTRSNYHNYWIKICVWCCREITKNCNVLLNI